MEKRFALALLLSAAILFAWQYFFRPIPQQKDAASPNQTTEINIAPVPSPSSIPSNNEPNLLRELNLTNSPQRNLSISTPLYNVRFDSRGAVATSWVIKKNKTNGRGLYSAAGNKNNPQQLELISQEGLRREPREAPFKIVTGDAALDELLFSTQYILSGFEDTSGGGGDVEIAINPGETKRIDFTLGNPNSLVNAVKSITFNADNYVVDLELRVNRGGQPVSGAKMLIGPSIGDQGVPMYDFYSVAPEAIFSVGGEADRFVSSAIDENEANPGRQAINGAIDWAGVGDTYFAMAAVPQNPLPGLEFRTSKYEVKLAGETQTRYLVSGFVPISTDGAPVHVYVGPKDHYLLTDVSQQLSDNLKRPIDLEGLIDYGFLSSVSRPLAVPILWSLKSLYALTGSYGVSIILFTIFIYSLFLPLKWRSSKAMKKAQKLAPQMKELQEKIKSVKQNDPQLKELQMEQLRLMKEGNPLGGCLPLLIQMPFLFALFRAITISIDFRQASFLWLPDLSATDPLHLLPFLMAGSMLVLQLITPAPSADPLQRKMMAVMMPLMMLYVLWSAPAALLVYWFVGNIVGFSQQLVINRYV